MHVPGQATKNVYSLCILAIVITSVHIDSITSSDFNPSIRSTIRNPKTIYCPISFSTFTSIYKSYITAQFVLVFESNRMSSAETHSTNNRFRCLFLDLYIMLQTTCAGTTGVFFLPSTVLWLYTHSTSNVWSMTFVVEEPRIWLISHTVILSSLL